MVQDFRLGEEFFALLVELDAEIARRVRLAGCQHCEGPLHQANYARKPRGAEVAGSAEAFRLRHSLCCGEEGCRRRALPPSLRFLGRRVYVEAVVLVASVVALLVAARRAARVEAARRAPAKRGGAQRRASTRASTVPDDELTSRTH